MARSTSWLLAALLALAMLGGCFGAVGSEDRRRAEEEVLQFHVRLNKGDIEAIWEGAGDELRRAVSHEDFTKLLEAVNRKLGDEQYTQTKSQTFMVRSGGTIYTLVQETQFDSGKGVETFVFKLEQSRAVLVGYYINSLDLLAP